MLAGKGCINGQGLDNGRFRLYFLASCLLMEKPASAVGADVER